MKSTIPLLAAVALLCGSATQGRATFINNATGLSNPAQTITFDEHPLADGTLVTNQYGDLGVTFDPGLYFALGGPTTNVINGNHLRNSQSSEGGGPYVEPFTVHFTQPVTAAAFGFAGDGTQYTFTALSQGLAVESGSATVGDGSFVGFTNITFDAIAVVRNPNDLHGPKNVLDNIQFNPDNLAPAPEPASITMLGIGGLSLLGFAWRRKQGAVTAA